MRRRTLLARLPGQPSEGPEHPGAQDALATDDLASGGDLWAQEPGSPQEVDTAPSDVPPSPDPAAAAVEVSSSNLLAGPAGAVGAGASLGGTAPVVALGGLGTAAAGGGGGGAAASASVRPPAVNALSPRLLTDTGRAPDIAAGGLMRDNTPGLSGTVAPGSTVAIYDGELLLGQASVSDGAWSFVTPALSDGLHTLVARFSSPKEVLSSQSISVQIDTRTTGSLSSDVLTDSGTQASIMDGGSTADRTLGLSGTAEEGSVVQVFDGERLLGSVSLAENSTEWRYITPSLAPGSHVLSARLIDAAGNVFETDSLQVNILAGFSIDFDYVGTASRYASEFERAAAFWSSVITDDLPDYGGVDDLRIRVSVDDIDGDGAGRTAGQAQVTAWRPRSLLPYQAELEIDSALLPILLADGRLYNLLRHEIGHALGFGVFFKPLGLLDPLDPFHYIGPNALMQYRKLTQSSASFIPLENTGGAGTVGSHWKESVFDHELMTGLLEAAGARESISALTLGVLQDLGYAVDYSQAEAYALPRFLSSTLDAHAVIMG